MQEVSAHAWLDAKTISSAIQDSIWIEPVACTRVVEIMGGASIGRDDDIDTGLDAVELRLKSGAVCRVGNYDTAGLAAALKF
jgi:hypothetical protein